MDSWLQDVSKDAKTHLKPVFDIVTTVKTIHNIKTEAFALGKIVTNLQFDCDRTFKRFFFAEKSPKWPSILLRLNLPSQLDLYNVYYQPLITDRLKEIIASSWSRTIDETQQKIDILIKSKSKGLSTR